MIQPEEVLAQNLHAFRTKRNLSLAGLSDLTGVSKSMLRQIETGQSSPTIATLWKIANGLRVPFTALMAEEEPAVTLRAFKESEPLLQDSEGYRLYPLVLFEPQRPFESYYVEIDPGTTLDAEAHQGHAQEHVFVTRGSIDISVLERCHTVETGHLLTFSADCAHRYQNRGEDMAAAIMLISYVS